MKGPIAIELRPRTRENVPLYFRRTQDAEVRRFLPQKAKTEAEALAEYEKTLLPGAASYGKSVYTDGRYIGDIWVYCLGGEDPDAMLSFCIFEKSLWGQGAATGAVRLFLPEIREKFGLKTLGAFTYSANVASVRVLQKSGFREVETFTEDGVESRYFQLELPRE